MPISHSFRFCWPSGQTIPPLDVQTSNTGTLDKDWILELYSSLYMSPKEGESSSNHIIPNDAADLNMRIIYPTTKTVENSPYGKEHGWYLYWTDTNNYVSPLMFDTYDNRYPGLLLHSKVYKQLSPDGIGWIYAGSHNM